VRHLDEGTVVAVRDGDAAAEPATPHLHECAPCADALQKSRSRSRTIAEALATLDEPVDIVHAKAAVRRRLDARRGDARPRRGWLRAHLGRAAAILVLTAGAASALPWSPVREWWSGPPGDVTPSAEPVRAVAAGQGSPAAGLSVAVPEGGIAVVIREAAPGAAIDVAWADGAIASISAPPGSAFSYADGRIEVVAAAGPVLLELPRTAGFVSVEVDGRIFLERSGDRLDIPGPTAERTDSHVRFVVPTR
jgi:hypothetical protein